MAYDLKILIVFGNYFNQRLRFSISCVQGWKSWEKVAFLIQKLTENQRRWSQHDLCVVNRLEAMINFFAEGCIQLRRRLNHFIVNLWKKQILYLFLQRNLQKIVNSIVENERYFLLDYEIEDRSYTRNVSLVQLQFFLFLVKFIFGGFFLFCRRLIDVNPIKFFI